MEISNLISQNFETRVEAEFELLSTLKAYNHYASSNECESFLKSVAQSFNIELPGELKYI